FSGPTGTQWPASQPQSGSAQSAAPSQSSSMPSSQVRSRELVGTQSETGQRGVEPLASRGALASSQPPLRQVRQAPLGSVQAPVEPHAVPAQPAKGQTLASRDAPSTYPPRLRATAITSPSALRSVASTTHVRAASPPSGTSGKRSGQPVLGPTARTSSRRTDPSWPSTRTVSSAPSARAPGCASRITVTRLSAEQAERARSAANDIRRDHMLAPTIPARGRFPPDSTDARPRERAPKASLLRSEAVAFRCGHDNPRARAPSPAPGGRGETAR